MHGMDGYDGMAADVWYETLKNDFLYVYHVRHTVGALV